MIKKVNVDGDEEFLNSDLLEELISGTFPMNIWPLYDAVAYSESDEGEDALTTSWVDFSEVLREVPVMCGKTLRIGLSSITASSGSRLTAFSTWNIMKRSSLRDFITLSDFSAGTYAIGIRSNSGTLSISFNAT
jgi:hypothetical protein